MKSAWNRLIKRKKTKKHNGQEQTSTLPVKNRGIYTSLDENIKYIKQDFGSSSDLVIREFTMGRPFAIKAASIYIKGLSDTKSLSRFIIEKLMNEMHAESNPNPWSPSQIGNYIKENLLPISNVDEIEEWNQLLSTLLAGQTILLVDGWDHALGCDSSDKKERSVSEPTTEVTIRGAKDSFTESLDTNTALVRSRIQSPNLWLETMKIGRISQTEVSIMYVNGIVNKKLIREVKNRLKKIEVDELLSSNTVEEWISDEVMTPFPTVLVTERPDVVAGNLMEGRITIFVNGTPFPLIVPATWNQFFQSAEDYYLNWIIVSFLRCIRIVSFFVTLFGTSLFIAFVSFHPELIPTPLLINIAAQRQTTPFPIIFEALLMEITFEILREAGIRMPRQVGQAVSIVGAIVLGEAAVMAGIVSSSMVIVVAATAIASFTISHSSMTDSIRLLRFGMMISASLFGLYGVGLGAIVLVAHLTSLRSFGIPYLTPYAPFIFADQKDAILRLPKPFLKKRPRLISQNNTKRTGDDLSLQEGDSKD
ncbi:spore germination protein [Halobacillus sp. B23F22_1]|uniref:spore germination protein n=1 Tax=Halobacillus sp. B23F22_1 TaxID=3459514 RepID=UPI00373E5A3A